MATMTISGLELGERNPTIITLWHAAQALGVEVHLLLKAESPADDGFELKSHHCSFSA